MDAVEALYIERPLGNESPELQLSRFNVECTRAVPPAEGNLSFI